MELVTVHVQTQNHAVTRSLIGYCNHSGAGIEKAVYQTDS